jgi:hypothetical protein
VQIRVLKKARRHQGVFVFSMVFNEEWFLPHFLEHHRTLGVDYFIFYDDCSTDRTREYLLSQDDCAVLAPEPGPAGRVRHGVWVQRIVSTQVPEREGPGRWGLVLDADEFVVLPTAFSTIGEMISFLDRQNRTCAAAAMVDFYPRRLSDRFYDPLSPFQACRWFDEKTAFRRNPETQRPEVIAEGVRPRLLMKLMQKFPDTIPHIYGDSGYRIGMMWKAPLTKTGQGIVRRDAHNLNVVVPADLQFALAHFKFYPGLDDRIDLALSREGHFQAGVEYRFLGKALELLSNESLICRSSVQYHSPADLERVGLTWSG